jgi:hypothetical protein
VPLSVKDEMAQDLLWEYAQRHRSVDAEFSDDLEKALHLAGYRRRRRAEAQKDLAAQEAVVTAAKTMSWQCRMEFLADIASAMGRLKR